MASELDVLLAGAKGPGKTDIVVVGSMRYAAYELCRALLVRTTWREVVELIDRMASMVRHLPRAKQPAWNGELKRYVWPSRAITQFSYVDEVKDVEGVQGRNWSYIGYDEMGKQKNPLVRDALIREIRCKDHRIVRMFRATANPGQGGHSWIKRLYIEPCGRDGQRVVEIKHRLPNGLEGSYFRRFIPGRIWDNPIYANDTMYMAQLMDQPETLRMQLLFGDWDVGEGLALDELDRRVHMVRPFAIPPNWLHFGAFDWGYDHPWVFGHYVVNEDGDAFKVDTLHGRRMSPLRIAEAIRRKVPVDRLEAIYAGHDVRNKRKAEGFDTPSIQEQLAEHGIQLTMANIDRVQGLNALRRRLGWRLKEWTGTAFEDGTPALRFFQTPGNEWCFKVLEAMTTSEDNREDVVEIEANAEKGIDGDDPYDETRYFAASRPGAAPQILRPHTDTGWSQAALRAERERLMRMGRRGSLSTDPHGDHLGPVD